MGSQRGYRNRKDDSERELSPSPGCFNSVFRDSRRRRRALIACAILAVARELRAVSNGLPFAGKGE